MRAVVDKDKKDWINQKKTVKLKRVNFLNHSRQMMTTKGGIL